MSTSTVIRSMASEVGVSPETFAAALGAGRVYMDRCGNLDIEQDRETIASCYLETEEEE